MERCRGERGWQQEDVGERERQCRYIKREGMVSRYR